MPVDKTRRRPRVSPAGSEWSTPRTRLVHRLSPGLSTGVEGWDTPLRKRPHTLPRTGIHLLEHALGLTRATPPSVHRRSCGRRPCPPQVGHAPSRAPEVRDSASSAARDAARPLPCTRGPDAAARGQLGDPPPSPRAGGRGGWLFLFDRGSPGVPPRHPLAPGACPRAVLPGRSRWGRSEAGGSRKDDAPSPPHPDARSDRGARRRTASGRHRGPGSGRGRREPSGSMRARPRTSLRARSSPRVLRRGRGWAVVTMRRARAAEHAPPRARLGRWRAVRRLKKVAGAYLSPLAPRHFRPEVAQ